MARYADLMTEEVRTEHVAGEKDPQNPRNWSFARRLAIIFLIGFVAFIVGFASSVDSGALVPAAADFNILLVVESCATGIFLIGFGVGALVAGPFSETLGRNLVYIVTMFVYMIFTMASGLAPNIGAQLAFRFIAGISAATPLVCAGGSLADMWDAKERTYVFPIFAIFGFGGPVFGPFAGGFIVDSPVLSWRWCEWITLIFSGLVLGLVPLFLPETYAPVLLQWKAKHLRQMTGDDRYREEIEVKDSTFLHEMEVALTRPFVLTVTEPIIMLIALCLTIVYIIVFTFLDGYVNIFQEPYNLSNSLTGCCFLGIVLGLLVCLAMTPLIWSWAKAELVRRAEDGIDHLAPEFRLWWSMLGGSFAIPIALFWMGWTCYSSISIASSLIASVSFGYGILCVFITRNC